MTDQHNSDSNKESDFTESPAPNQTSTDHDPSAAQAPQSANPSEQVESDALGSEKLMEDSSTSASADEERKSALLSPYTDIPGEKLESALGRLLKSVLPNYSDTHLDALSARLGWTGDAPITLHNAGKLADITRERVRQIESRVKRDIQRNIPTPVRLFVEQLPERAKRWSDVALHLVNAGITERRWSIKAAKALLDQVGESHKWDFIDGARDSIISPRGLEDLSSLASTVAVARRVCRASGAVSLAYISECLEEDVPLGLLRDMILCADEMEFITNEYVWIPSSPTKRVRIQNVAKKMLSVNRPLKLDEVRRGLERKFSFRNKTGSARYKGVVPPDNVLIELFRAYPAFRVYANDIVDHVGPLSSEEELTRPEAAIVAAFKHYNANVLDRQTIKEFGDNQGINMISLEVEMTYSPIVAQIRQNVWRLVGNFATEEEVAEVMERVRKKGFQNRLTYKGFASNGNYRIVLRLPRFVHNFVASVPSEIGGASLEKTLYTQDRVSLRCKNGAIFGFGKFLGKSGCKEGDFLTIELDLNNDTFTWSLSSSPPTFPDQSEA